MPDHDEEPTKEFHDSFDMFVRRGELRDAINNSKCAKKERLQEQYIDFLKSDNELLDKKRMEAESRVPSSSDGVAPTGPQPRGNKGAEEGHSVSHSSKAGLRNKLKLWLEKRAGAGSVLTKDQCLEAAQIEFKGRIAMNMLKEVWREAELPKTWREKGRRPGT